MFASALAGAGGLMAPRGPGTIPSDRFPFDMPDMMKPKAGMFGAGKGNIGEAISAAILGALASRNNPGAAVGLQMLHQRRNLAQQQELAAQERENNFQDFVRREAYKAANKPPEVPEILERVQALNSLRPGLGDTYAQNFAQNGGSLFGRMFTDPSTGQQFMLGGQAGSAPQIGQEVDDPRKGGPGLAGPGGFPGSY